MLNQLSYLYLIIISLILLIYLFIRYLILQSKINKLENEFTSIVNHTFRTPITRILWIIKELEKDLPIEEKLLYLQNLENTTEKILAIVEIIAGIKKIDDLSGYHFEAISLREIVEKSIQNYRDKIREKKLEFNVSSFQNIPLLSVDLKKITFVINTLIENAIFYTPKDGKILIGCLSNKKGLIFYISDNGIGLNNFDKLRIFSRFYRNKKATLMNTDGIGLCLYLSKKIIKRHHGEIYAKSKGVNKGSTFFVKIPFKK
jgi:two-component system sensor histidine kinase VicK